MKKLLSRVLIAIYSTASFGMSVKEFYCCGKLSSISISFNAVAKESITKNSINRQAKDGSCCKTKLHLLKVKDNHLNVQAVVFPAKQFTHLNILPRVFNIVAYSNPQHNITSGINDPPLVYSSTSICIFTGNFRI